ncbi:hypothetical protein LCGC14_0946460 [marine sediment metagenome]|uniref:Uncharacterized protein n=1 Tax=marine sediment metagenome TaxID=412755 RepID=A0A0F9RPY9_9ZZZZ
MPVDPETAIANLMQSDPHIIAGAVLKGKEIIYTTDNWDISGDVSRVVSSWMGKSAQFIMVSGVKYSVLQMEDERLVAMSYKGDGSIVGAKNDERKIIAYLDPDGYGPTAVMDVQRALTSLSEDTVYLDVNAQLGQKSAQMGGAASAEGAASASSAAPAGGAASASSAAPAGGGGSVDPQLQGEIKAFLDWIKDSEGLVGYINYHVQQNNAKIISELSKIYSELRQIFGV